MSNVLQCHLLQGKFNRQQKQWSWMLRRPHEYDGHCDTDSTAKLVVVIAAAVVVNAESYSKSFSVQVTTTATIAPSTWNVRAVVSQSCSILSNSWPQQQQQQQQQANKQLQHQSSCTGNCGLRSSTCSLLR